MAPDQHGTKSQDVCGIYGVEIRPFSGPERSARNEANLLWKNFEGLGISKISGPVAPYYATYRSRLKSFDNWTMPDIQSPEKLAEAGFYYTSTQDNVLCFHCGGGLKNWEVDDDPWEEHALWFSRCGYVLLQKGRDFVKEVLAKAEVLSAAEDAPKVKTEPVPKVEMKNDEKRSDEGKLSKEASEPTLSEQSSKYGSTSKSDKEEIELCRICYTKEREIVFLPCGHFVCCSQCAPSLSTCAVCRKPFEAVIRAYLS